MEAGSGGIRWNAATKWIQIRSTAGQDSWIDWRYYSTDYTVKHEFAQQTASSATSQTISQTIALTKIGLYCITLSGYDTGNPRGTINTNGIIVNNFEQETPGSSGLFLQEQIIYSDGNSKSIGFSKVGSFASIATLIYVGPFRNVSDPSIIILGNNSNQQTKTYTSQNQFIHFTLGGCNRYNRTFSTSNIESDYIDTWDPGIGNTFSGACINRGGTVVCTGTAGVYTSNTGRYIATSYTLVE